MEYKTYKALLIDLVKAGNELRSTAIVDDDFVAKRDRFDFLLGYATGVISRPGVIKPTYYVGHPDGSFTPADPQPEEMEPEPTT